MFPTSKRKCHVQNLSVGEVIVDDLIIDAEGDKQNSFYCHLV